MIEKMNERITIEKSTVVADKVGNHRNTWEEYFTGIEQLQSLIEKALK